MQSVKILKNVVVSLDTIQVVECLSKGLSVSEIAKIQGVGLRTMEGRIYSIKNKFSVRSLPELVAFFFRNNLIK